MARSFQKVYPDDDLSVITHTYHPVFKVAERQFWKWMDEVKQNSEYYEMYFSDEAIYDKKAAIQQAIEEAYNEATETGRPVDLLRFDFAAIFQG